MLEIDPKVICHNLAIDTKVKPIAQKKKKVGKEKHKTIVEETKKLTHAGFTREIQFTTWLAIVVMVPKALRKMEIYVDFIDLNKACPKDAYQLSSINKLLI